MPGDQLRQASVLAAGLALALDQGHQLAAGRQQQVGQRHRHLIRPVPGHRHLIPGEPEHAPAAAGLHPAMPRGRRGGRHRGHVRGEAAQRVVHRERGQALYRGPHRDHRYLDALIGEPGCRGRGHGSHLRAVRDDHDLRPGLADRGEERGRRGPVTAVIPDHQRPGVPEQGRETAALGDRDHPRGLRRCPEEGHGDPPRAPGPQSLLDRGTGVGDMHVHVPELAAADDHQRVAQAIEPFAQPGDRLGRRVQQVGDLISAGADGERGGRPGGAMQRSRGHRVNTGNAARYRGCQRVEQDAEPGSSRVHHAAGG